MRVMRLSYGMHSVDLSLYIIDIIFQHKYVCEVGGNLGVLGGNAGVLGGFLPQ